MFYAASSACFFGIIKHNLSFIFVRRGAMIPHSGFGGRPDGAFSVGKRENETRHSVEIRRRRFGFGAERLRAAIGFAIRNPERSLGRRPRGGPSRPNGSGRLGAGRPRRPGGIGKRGQRPVGWGREKGDGGRDR